MFAFDLWLALYSNMSMRMCSPRPMYSVVHPNCGVENAAQLGMNLIVYIFRSSLKQDFNEVVKILAPTAIEILIASKYS